MKNLIKIALVLIVAFASTALIVRSTGLVTEESALAFIERAKDINPLYLIAVPTMTTILIAGYTMGPVLGGAASAIGLMTLGLGGYGMGRRLGRTVLARLFKDEAKLADIEQAFARNDLLTLFACQALPILPELSCTLAGIARMNFGRFLFGYSVGVIPFAFIVAWAGSKSTLSNPAPAIYTGIAVSVGLLLLWSVIKKRTA
jgi:uncharacterized membrane protein YdjX (TVP38/TMEM64 family)